MSLSNSWVEVPLQHRFGISTHTRKLWSMVMEFLYFRDKEIKSKRTIFQLESWTWNYTGMTRCFQSENICQVMHDLSRNVLFRNLHESIFRIVLIIKINYNFIFDSNKYDATILHTPKKQWWSGGWNQVVKS